MTNVVIRFEEVSIRVEKTGKCVVCGRRTKRSEKFSQTLSPFNQRDGTPKTREQIHEELEKERKAWMEVPVVHKKCEPETS